MRDVKAEDDLIPNGDPPHLFTGIPADLLIGQPLQAVAKGQQVLYQTYIQAINHQALTYDDSSKEEQNRNALSQSSND